MQRTTPRPAPTASRLFAAGGVWPARSIVRLMIFVLTLLIASAHLAFPSAAQKAEGRQPISEVQMEKLLRVIDRQGQNVRLNDEISAALGLGGDLLIRQATATDPVARESYFFATVPATGQYLVGTRELTGSDMFLVDPDLRLVAGVSTRDKIRKIPLPEAGRELNDILMKFEAFLELN